MKARRREAKSLGNLPAFPPSCSISRWKRPQNEGICQAPTHRPRPKYGASGRRERALGAKDPCCRAARLETEASSLAYYSPCTKADAFDNPPPYEPMLLGIVFTPPES